MLTRSQGLAGFHKLSMRKRLFSSMNCFLFSTLQGNIVSDLGNNNTQEKLLGKETEVKTEKRTCIIFLLFQ